MRHYRICKYHPGRRGPQGTHLDIDDWVGPEDIGRYIRGNEFEAPDFLRMEARYIRAVRSFFFASQLPHLRLTNIVPIDDEWREEFKSLWPDLHDPRLDEFEPREDMIVQNGDIDIVAMMNMRSFQACQLHVDERFHVHFGWGFYVYVATERDCPQAVSRTERDGLFVDESRSPHTMPPGFSTPYRIEVFGNRSKERIDEMTKILEGFTKHDLRPAFGFSDEHPLFGTFEIGIDTQEKLRDLIPYDFDSELYSCTLRRDPWM